VKQKENIFEELDKMRNLIHTKPGVVISEQTNVAADVGTIMRELEATFNADEEVVVNTIKKYKDKASFKQLVDQYKTITGKDFGERLINSISQGNDKKDWDAIKSHLATMGVTLGQSTKNAGNTAVATFDGLGSPSTVVSPEELARRESLWQTTYSCVPSHPDAKMFKLKDGTTTYKIGEYYYYNTGKKFFNKTLTPYNCSTEFKSRAASNPEGRANVVSSYSKELQTSLGMTPTGQLSDADIDSILKRLEGGESVGATSSDTQSIPMDANGQPDIDKIIASL
jgi:hypothetical protein